MNDVNSIPYDAILIIGFGGPESKDEVLPFLENVLRGRNVPRERLLEVAEHYYHFGGVSPINAQVRELISVLKPALGSGGIDLPVYWGNRNWHPLLTDTVKQMTEDGVKRALGVVLAAYSSYSSCRQYREDIAKARFALGPSAPVIDKMRVFYNHPNFISANASRIADTLKRFPNDRQKLVHVAFTAHSIPAGMAEQSRYVTQLDETCRLIGEHIDLPAHRWKLVYQSRSGRPTDPWLEPDINDHIRSLAEQGIREVLIHPVGFLSDHMEVLYDLDDEAKRTAEAVGITMKRAATVGTHPDFISMFVDLISERLGRTSDKLAIGRYGPSHDVCPVDCCPAPAPRPAARPSA